ncbi:transcriptional regulator, TetR family [Nannocystis exedens]|uniref:Transcriptional regulator, TetR family n=1 Tax=Nannocystis exedens TaxID=54 RepID=A0A1I2E8Q8_9BACT|nr:TetR/AcrR family transcriptional regulator [Nannocystis exedens]PCC74888.1 TetR family transcriptional regulator [Nannocystis exedens]SFE89225.1 transcriptional regulator, TetR family [Nannocystis exedens]
MSDVTERSISPSLVRAAVDAAEQRGEAIADVPLTAIAAAAGISRSTLLRRLGGSRRALDEAVRAAGLDLGGREPVRERAVVAGAQKISEAGIAALTLESVADAAGCSVHSLYVTFGGRDGLLAAIFERYSPLHAFEELTADASTDLRATVRAIYRALVANLDREPRVTPALLADVFSRPDGPASRIFQRFFPRLLASVGAWLSGHVHAGRIRPLPLTILLQQLIGPLAIHLLIRPAWGSVLAGQLPDVATACELFADNFLRAVAVPNPEREA